MKKIFALILTLAMMLSIASVAASATGRSTTGGSTTGDSTVGAPTTGDTTTGDSTTGGSTTGDSTLGDSTTGDTTTGGGVNGGDPIAPPSGGGSVPPVGGDSAPSTPAEPEAPANPFTDVSSTAYYYDAVQWLIAQGITEGKTATTFEPNSGCTRAQMVTFLWRAAGCPEPAATTTSFTDVSADAYYTKAVLWAVEKGITLGATATTFDPNATCTRGQMAAFLYRHAGSPAVTQSHSFDDVDPEKYYNACVAWLIGEEITNGTTATTYSPDNTCTRGQMAAFLYRYLAD